MIRVIKRNGRIEKLDVSKIQKYTADSVKGLENVSQSELEVDAKLQFRDMISTEEIQQTLIKTAVDKIDIDRPDWTFVASRLFLYDLYHKANGFSGYSHLKDYLTHGESEGRIVLGLKDKYDLDDLNDYIKPDRDLQFTYLGIRTLYDRYLIKDKVGKPIELPQQLFMGVSMFLAQNELDCQNWAKKFYDILSKFEVMAATPTLSNARTPRHQLSSCYIGSTSDNIEGIFDAYKEMALLSKFGGGIGWDWSRVRGMGSYIDGHKHAAGGIIPFLKIANDVAIAVDQLGCVAKNSFIRVLKINDIKTIPISEVRIGDLVESFNIELNKVQYKKVEAVHELEVKKDNQIKISFKDGYIVTSKWHPMAIKGTNGYFYKRSDEIEVGEFGVNHKGEADKILAIDNNPEISEEYMDLTVQGTNNYFASTDKSDNFYLTHNTRKGAIAVYIEPWHIDIKDFLDLKKNSGEERRRGHDLFPALWLNDLFMERVESDGLWTLFDPYEVSELTDLYGKEFNQKYIELEKKEGISKEVIPAKNLWKDILRSYFETGNPFLTFKDTANISNPNKNSGIIRSSNLCTEIFQNTAPNHYKIKVTYDNNTTDIFEEDEVITVDNGMSKPARKITALDSLNGKQIWMVDKEEEDGETAVCNLASVNLSKINSAEDIARVVPTAIRMLDNVIDLNFYPLSKVKVTNEKSRAIGLGVMGEAQMLAEKSIQWGTNEHFNKIDEVMEAISYHAIHSSSDLALEKGKYSTYEGSDWSKGIFPIDKANKEACKLVDRGGLFGYSYDWQSLKLKVKTDGIRNGYLMAIAPTSSISILTGTTQAIEPVYKRKWFEENLSGLIPVVVPNLSPKTWKYYTPSYEIDQKLLIRAGAIRQKWIDQGQSLNIFVSLDKASGKYLNDIYMDAWKFGLKSTYYLRSQSPEAVEEIEGIEDRSLECVGCQ
ncbi:Ribonucleotide reductase of class Ia (aerobic), alpha subunit [hydrothermal vent metagenome]|uniref:ribonucleoside-diphosphate reductase n=1 Tax=hydrothermal vent metagenome TaxID=652676 RepID=A0A1W1CDN9_9ZZZZ